MAEKKASLVLGSGGARGLAHIGVIRCLEDRGYRVRYIAGSSIGALVGGIYATGKLDVYVEWVSALQKSDIVRLLDLSLGGSSLFKGERIIAVLRDLIGDCDIEDLAMGYTAVATDLSYGSAGREMWFNRGPLFEAIRASIAVPTIFSPVKKGHRILVDGGIVNPVPIAPTLNDHTDITIAVDLNGRYEAASRLAKPDTSPRSAIQSKYRRGVRRYFEKLWPSAGYPKEQQVGMSDIVTRTMEFMQTTITQFNLAATTPSVVVRIPRNLCGFFDFYRANELIDFGYQRAEQALDDYHRNAVDENGMSRYAKKNQN